MWEREAKAVADAVARDYPPEGDDGSVMWIASQSHAARIIDCVISLNRRYKSFVLPRVEGFVKRFPHIRSCQDLARHICSCRSTEDFPREMLEYNFPEIGVRVLGVTQYLIDVQKSSPAGSEAECLQRWAIDSRPRDLKKVGVYGFGIAGFQYLRVLFGAETSKPDIYIVSYVREAVGRRVSPIKALAILEEAAKIAGRSVRRLDYLIWNDATSEEDSDSGCCLRSTPISIAQKVSAT